MIGNKLIVCLACRRCCAEAIRCDRTPYQICPGVRHREGGRRKRSVPLQTRRGAEFKPKTAVWI